MSLNGYTMWFVKISMLFNQYIIIEHIISNTVFSC